jgi:hypothetical protein
MLQVMQQLLMMLQVMQQPLEMLQVTQQPLEMLQVTQQPLEMLQVMQQPLETMKHQETKPVERTLNLLYQKLSLKKYQRDLLDNKAYP